MKACYIILSFLILTKAHVHFVYHYMEVSLLALSAYE